MLSVLLLGFALAGGYEEPQCKVEGQDPQTGKVVDESIITMPRHEAEQFRDFIQLKYPHVRFIVRCHGELET